MTLGLDLSLTETGWYHLPGKGLPAKGGTIICGKRRGLERIAFLRSELVQLIADCQRNGGVRQIVFEGYAFGAVGKQHEAGEWGGVARMLVYDANIRAYSVPPSVLKKFVTDKGNAKKEEMLLAIYKRWGREFQNHNEADAFALAVMGSAHLPEENEGSYYALFGKYLTQTQVLALHKAAPLVIPRALSARKKPA